MIIVNFKTYESATGDNALALARVHETVARETGVKIAIAVQMADLFRIASQVSIPVYAQHCDAIEFGASTGWTLPEAISQAGGRGSLLNHSEHRFGDRDRLGNIIKRFKALGLASIVCAENDDEGKEIMQVFSPDFIAVEPPELIGGDISVSTARPELISEAVKKIGTHVLVGAGVKTAHDVRIALELGADGILLASGITKASDPAAVLRELAGPFQQM